MPKPTFSPMSIAGQTVLITGASSGFGEACAWTCAEAGCRLVLLARRFARLEALKDELVAEYPGRDVHIIGQDVMDTTAMLNLADRLPAEFAKVDILVNNAGLALGTSSAQDNDIEDAAIMLNTNVLSVMAITKAFLKGMIERNKGHIVNISSVAAKESYSGGSMYCASKHALQAYTNALRHDLLATDIRVTTICPGACKTEFSLVRFKGDAAKANAVYDGFLPLLAADIADNVMYAVTRPAHVQIADILVLCTHQSGAKSMARPLLEQQPQAK